MNTIQIFSDETYSSERSFQIISTIWGNPIDYKDFSKKVKQIIENYSIGDDYKGIHANKINSKNWHILGVVARSVLETLSDFILHQKLNAQVTLISRDRFEGNAGYLKSILRAELENRDSFLGKRFISLDDKDLPALYHRLDQLFVYLYYRDKFGNDGDQFEFYPDSTGKILNYEKTKFPITGNIVIDYPMNFYRIIAIVGDSFSKILQMEGWPIKKQTLSRFQPLKWISNYLIQNCDILSNFFLCLIRSKMGMTDPKYSLKAQALDEHFALNTSLSHILPSFVFDGVDVECVNDDLFGTIDFN